MFRWHTIFVSDNQTHIFIMIILKSSILHLLIECWWTVTQNTSLTLEQSMAVRGLFVPKFRYNLQQLATKTMVIYLFIRFILTKMYNNCTNMQLKIQLCILG